jgi:hypothetical protein
MVLAVGFWTLGIMSRRGREVERNDFGGGLHTTAAITEVAGNEAYDLSNIVVGPNGNYFRSRYGNTTFNASAMNSGAAIQGLGYFKPISGNDHLVAICGTKVYESTSLDGTMNDISGTVTVTASQDDIWTTLTFNNLLLLFGGPSTSPDAPLKYSGSGNAAALNGSPPSAYGAVQGNNRVFAFRTSASPSIVQWCKLGDPTDWTSTGSGSQTISTSDGEPVTAMAILDNSTALVFKQTSIHKMMINQLVSSAFPVFPLFRNVGCAGKHAVVVADGLCYFMTPQGKMKITDGIRILEEKDLPQLAFIDDLWSAMNTSRIEFIQGKRVTGEDYDHIVWLMTSTGSGTTHDTALVWDIRNKCWLRHKTGWKMNVLTTLPTGAIYTGGYAGVIYKQDVSSATTDASESSSNVDSYWTSGWDKFGSYEKNKTVEEAYLSYATQSSGTIDFSWGYDFSPYQKTQAIDETSPGGRYDQAIYDIDVYGGQTDQISRIFPIGNGQVFQYRIRNSDLKMKINSLILLGKKFAEA